VVLGPAEVFSTADDRPIQQGDIFVTAGIVRVASAADTFCPAAWAPYETSRTPLAEASGSMVGLDAAGGRALVMVVSHDCHLDKELNVAARALMRVDGLDETTAYERAEQDPGLDRHVLVSPLVTPQDLPVAAHADTLVHLQAGGVVGYFPVPASQSLGVSACVVDLGHRSCVDRLTLTQRLTSLTDPARLQLRYALARMDSLRTPDLGAELEAAVGQRIDGIERPTAKRSTIVIALHDGSRLELLPRPGNTPVDGPRRHHVPT
jgi:hypothetical protein